MKPSIEQQRVLDVKDKNIIVSASAGSGKTTVMTTKIKEFISQGNSVKDILVLTYTKASATEMKLKLEKKLLEDDSEFVQNQIDDLSTSDISTFHSFCQKLIKKYFYILAISPNFDILEDLQQKTLLEKAYSDAVKSICEHNEENYIFTLETFFTGRNENSLKEMVYSLKDFFDSSLSKDYKQKTLEFLHSNFAYDNTDKYITDNLSYIIKKLENLQIESKEYGFDSYVEYINNLLSQLYCILKVGFEKKLLLIEALNYGILRKQKSDEIGFKDKIAYVKNISKKFTDNIKDKSYSEFEKVKNNSIKISLCLFELCEKMCEFYHKRKLELNKFDYSDLEKYTLKLLQDEKVREYLKNKYKLICIDEFQDANEVQEEIISLLAKTNNRFMVGDVKQSIYAFRQSNPDIFLKIEENYKKDKDKSVALTLNDNYRSDKKILDFVNIVFSKIMTKNTCGIDYENTAQFNGVVDYKNTKGKQVVIDILQNQQIEKIKYRGVYSVKDTKDSDDEDNIAEKEGLLVANRICSLIGSEIYDKDLDCFREVRYEDICILLRSRGNYQKVFASTLADAGIPLSVNSNSLLYETPEGKKCLNLLKYVSNSQDDICLVSTMLAFFDFTEQDLADIKLNTECEYFYLCVKNYNKQDEIKVKIEHFNSSIQKLKQDIKFLGLYEGLYNFFIERNVFDNCNVYPDSERRILNYKTFLNLLNKDITLEEFLSYKISPNIVNLCIENSVVNLTTIHSSKGLEYPIVFVCNLANEFYKDKKNNNLVLSKEYGVITKVADLENRKALNSVYFDTIKRINKNQDFAEKIRLLYVALTRAKNHLFLVGTKNKLDFKEFKQEFEILNSANYLDLIVNSLGEKVIENIIESNTYETDNLQINVYKGEKNTSEILQDKFVMSKVDNQKVECLHNYINFKPLKNNITLKNSVSSINNEEYTNNVLKPDKLTIDEHLTGESSEKGTLIHKILELVDFDKIENKQDLIEFLNTIKNEYELKLNDINIDGLFENILTLKKVAKGNILKEKTFVMKVPYNTIVESEVEDKVLVQGIVDLIILGEKNIIIDYKLTSILNDEKLKNTYTKQLKLYKMAVELGMNINVDNVYIFNLNKNKLIPLEI